ncbi:DUF2093 domain-containing protein [Brevundimonas sp. M1A4_2e]|jgi:hypothetical protein|uniref:Uncharacterized protein n=1 Tax=Brevundimonas naejangsanensis TaxID=588932 RepID=A0A172Y6I4_9CAUL|nr:DUF2093 domain-containing protein [Brevundimonas naejangsanensis]ANF54833.1 hypothetical protein DA69_08810 [Brevundimonas naejangsanensis]QBQ47446.1 DUF2093 domain-containing protein [Brevundimonas naejangsanensis]
MSTQISQDSGQTASLHYGDGEFAVLSAGAFVRCAVSGVAIPLTALRYWSVERQEAYAGPREYLAAASSPN